MELEMLLAVMLQEPEMVEEMLLEALPPRPLPQAPLSGFVLASSVLLAARLARKAAEGSQFDLDSLQVIQGMKGPTISCSELLQLSPRLIGGS